MKKVFVAHVTTNGGDHHLYAFVAKPSTAQVARLVWAEDGENGDPAHYEDHLDIEIRECPILGGKKK
jgi:hypothetical protein